MGMIPLAGALVMIFAVFGLSRPQEVQAALDQHFPGEYIAVEPNCYLLSSPKQTSKEIAVALGLSGGSNGRGIVTSVNGYWGHHQNDIWEWLKSRWNES